MALTINEAMGETGSAHGLNPNAVILDGGGQTRS
jgi:hypothetical protein